MPKSLLVAIMRNEGPYILEWVAHHRAIGFTSILVFTNDCTDGSDAMLDRLMEIGLVVHMPNPKTAFHALSTWQVAALRYASRSSLYRKAELVCTIDADEFLEVSVGDGTLGALVAQAQFDLMSLPVIGYRSDGETAIKDGSVQDRFTVSRADMRQDQPWPPRPTSVKTLSRPDIPHAHFRNHRPKIEGFSGSGMVWLDGSGKPYPADFTDKKVNGWVFNARPALAHVNHHSLRSRDSFLVKNLRGDAVTASRLGTETKQQIGAAIKYWNSRNHGDLPPRVVHRPEAALDLWEQLKADPALRDLHDHACEIHTQNANALLATPSGQALIAGMTM